MTAQTNFADRIGPRTLLAWLFGTAALLVVCLLLIPHYESRANSNVNSKPLVSTAQEERIAACKKETLNELQLKNIGIQELNGIQTLCFVRIGEEDELSEYGIRRGAYLIQQSETTVLMWMVVIITISGVVLAAMQLIASYKLVSAGKAAMGQETTMSVEAHKFSISSSVSGILILVVSLGFFYIFTIEIYTIREDQQKQAPAVPGLINSDLQPGLSSTPNKAIVPVDKEVERLANEQKGANGSSH